MSAFDATIRVGEASVQLIEDQDGKFYEAQLVLGVLALAPVGPGQAIPVPFGALRVPLDKRTVADLKAQLEKAEEQLTERSNIAIASDLGAAEKAAQLTENLRG